MRYLYLTLLLFVVLWSTQLRAAAKIDEVRVWRAPDHTRVVLELSDKVEFSTFRLDNPSRVVVDMRGISAFDSSLISADALNLQGAYIKRLRSARRGDDKYRLVIDVEKAFTSNIFFLKANGTKKPRLVIDLHDIEKEDKPQVVKSIDQYDGRREILIAIDAGHGGEDPGAIGPSGLYEKNVAMAISTLLKKKIDSTQGYRAMLVRTGDYYIKLSKRRKIARDANADIFLSIHADAFTDNSPRGGSVYTLSQTGASSASAAFLAEKENAADRIGGVPLNDTDDLLASVLLDLSMTATLDSSVRAANAVLDEMRLVGKVHKQTVEHAGFAVLKSPDMPSMLIETGFISNPKEEKLLNSKRHQKKLANAIARGVAKYFDVNAVEGTWVYWSKKNGGASARIGSYKVRSGDTLSEIAARHKVSMRAIKKANKMKSDKIRVGSVLKIPR